MAPTVPLLTAALVIISPVMAHMSLYYPPQFQTPWNPKAKSIDMNHRDPIIRQTFPCKLAHQGMTEQSSVATWTAGSSQKFTVTGTATHNGGSCQASLSYDQGKTFKVIHSYIGGCPLRDMQSFNFKVPADAPAGLAIFSWSWFNYTGNREFYQKCAAVTIKPGSGSAKVVFSQRPLMFTANLDESRSVCKSIEGVNLVFPNPGPDVTGSLNGPAGYTGTCQKKGAALTSGASSSKSFLRSSFLRKRQEETEESVDDSPPVDDNAPPNNTTALDDGALIDSSRLTGRPNGFPTSPDGSCGPGVGYQCIPGACCSQWGFCGFFEGHCGDKCQSDYGQCTAGKPGGIPGGVPPPTGGGNTPVIEGEATGLLTVPFRYMAFVGIIAPWIGL